MSKKLIIIDNRIKRMERLLQEARREKPKNLQKIISLRGQLFKLKEEEFLG